MDLERILDTIQPFLVMFVALLVAFFTALWVSAAIWAFRDIRARTRDIFAQILATLMVLLFFPLFPVPGLILYMILRPRETLADLYERTLEEEALLQGIEERLACPSCNRRIEEDYVVCPACHTRLKKTCTACGRQLHLTWSVCAYCGSDQSATRTTPMLHPEPVPLAVERPPETRRLAAASSSSLPAPAGNGFDDTEDMVDDWDEAAEHAPLPEAALDEDVEAEVGSEPEGELPEEDQAEAESMAEVWADTEPDAAATPESPTAAGDEPEATVPDPEAAPDADAPPESPAEAEAGSEATDADRETEIY